MLAEEIIPTVRIRTFPNQKPWVDRSIRAATYNSGLATGDMSAYKAASYGIRRAGRDTKRQYRERLESHFHQGDTWSM
ncbi:interferon-inducible GTPase 5-like protein [Labeo rohita]|uniref:Interferon-inducible GTPase 5-like protein n=1 Tax=Labeo rohita TaxID=84645 RepID=A0A498LCN7_LABRO|nr:interferon-inducible GTPase 5-like protein [Labeo rohita]